MSAHATPTSSSSSSSSPFASSGRSLLSRLTLPLRSRARNLTDFHIRPQEPHRRYSPGDLVKGAVVLTVVRPVRVTHITVCLHGFVRVYKRPNAANELLPPEPGLTPSSNRKKSQYFGNGHASLFQDEATLCGEGRLEPGVYEFNFEMEFPSEGLPTSIDFERGTITYMVTATITRPTSIAATSSCDQKLSLIETVDIGPLEAPKPRTISLEPISRRPRRRKTGKGKDQNSQEAFESGPPSDTITVSASPHPDESASQYGSADHSITPRSPVPSEMQSTVSAATGTESTASSSTAPSFMLGPVPSSAKSQRDSQRGSSSSVTDKTITATIQLLKSGCLPGDNLPLKISIKHTKSIKSLHGIIITLYRQGRIDSAPPLSLFVDIKGKAAEQMKHEEYYPKSKTGLAGLSLSSAGSSSLFRKDLAQTFAPILVDPATLTAVVNASVRVPEDVFPTISHVPGEMISFKYHVEVVVDLGGKLAGQQRHLPRVGTVTLPASYGTSSGRADGNPNMLATWGGSIVDTDHIRREKSVVACVFELVVGSVDSARKRGASSSARRQSSDGPEETPATPSSRNDPIHEEPYSTHDSNEYASGAEQYQQYYQQNYDGNQYYEGYDYPPYHGQYSQSAYAQIPVPAPEVQPEEELSEKERIRRAEERLLPSQPSQSIESPSSPRTIVAATSPSAPLDEGREDLYSAEEAAPHTNSSILGRPLGNEGSSSEPPIAPSAPSAPVLEDLANHTDRHASDDKQELERQRMLAEASAPSDFGANGEANGGEGGSAPHHEPSAPAFAEDEEYGGQYSHQSGSAPPHESLPRYER